MKGRVMALGALLALFAAFLTRGAGPGPAPAPIAPVPVASALPAPPPSLKRPEPARDPFRYLEEAVPIPSDPPPTPDALISAPLAPPPPPLRLIGFVERGERLLAALSLNGVVVTAGAGESAQGYLVLSVDEDAGVRLRGPDGAELVLEQPGE